MASYVLEDYTEGLYTPERGQADEKLLYIRLYFRLGRVMFRLANFHSRPWPQSGTKCLKPQTLRRSCPRG